VRAGIDRPTIDAGGGTYEPEAVEAGITALQRAIGNLSIGQFHRQRTDFLICCRRDWGFSDMVIS
jgi:hypothetical protein